MTKKALTLSERDHKHLWHPLTQHKGQAAPLAIAKAEGALLIDDRGKTYIDGIASWYTCMYGHCHPHLLERVRKQLPQLDHVVFSGFTHEPAVAMSEALMRILPNNQQKMFFSDNGSTSVDVALKMALQYHFNRGNKKTKIIALEQGFHGDTFGAMSVSGLSVYNGPFEDFLLSVERIAVPTALNFEQVKSDFEGFLQTGDVAAFIFEPLVQGAAAMRMYDASFLDELIAMAQGYGVLCIADEVMTGFGKTGKNFASEYLQNTPDIFCLSKSLTGGLVPMALTTCTQAVYDAFYDDALDKGFFHGHTYSANPLGCTAVLASIELLVSEEMQAHMKRIAKHHRAFQTKINAHPRVKASRHLGVIFALDLAVEMERYGSLRDDLFRFFMERGVCLRPLGNTLYILPPFVISDDQLQQIYRVIEEALEVFGK